MKMFTLVLALMIGTAMAVVEENAAEEWGSRSPTGNCHCEQTQVGGVHGHSPASFCDKGCPGGSFCSQARVPPHPLLPLATIPLRPHPAPLLLPAYVFPPYCSTSTHTSPHALVYFLARSFTAAALGRSRRSTGVRGCAPRPLPRRRRRRLPVASFRPRAWRCTTS